MHSRPTYKQSNYAFSTSLSSGMFVDSRNKFRRFRKNQILQSVEIAPQLITF